MCSHPITCNRMHQYHHMQAHEECSKQAQPRLLFYFSFGNQHTVWNPHHCATICKQSGKRFYHTKEWETATTNYTGAVFWRANPLLSFPFRSKTGIHITALSTFKMRTTSIAQAIYPDSFMVNSCLSLSLYYISKFFNHTEHETTTYEVIFCGQFSTVST